MTTETVAEPNKSPNRTIDLENGSDRSVGIANSFSDSQQRRNRIVSTKSLPAEVSGLASPRPLPKRPKGRVFVGGFLISLLLGFGYAIWSAFFSIVAHGIIEGRKLEIAALQTSVIRTIHVREGSFVQQGDPLISVECVEKPDLNRGDAAGDLRNALCDLEIEIARLRVNASLKEKRTAPAKAEYYQLLGEYLKEQVKLDELIDKFRRSQQLNQRNSIGVAELRTSEFDVKGQREKVAKLGLAVEEMKKNADSAGEKIDLGDLVQAHFSRIENFRNRVDEQTFGDTLHVIHAPVSGKIIRIDRFTGERIAAGEPALEILEHGSCTPVLYIKQAQTAQFDLGQQIQVQIEPGHQMIQCTIEMIGDQYEEVPDGLKNKITKQDFVVPLKLSLCAPELARDGLRLGARVTFPRNLRFATLFNSSSNQPMIQHRIHESRRPD